MKTARSDGPFSASGTGERSLIRPKGSIMNATRDACTLRITTLPAQSEKILAELKG